MDFQQLSSVPVYAFLLGVSSLLLIGFALCKKGDVRAGLRINGVEVFLDTKDRPPQEPPKPAATEPTTSLSPRPREPQGKIAN